MTYLGAISTPASPQWTLRRNDTASAARLSALDATVAECQLVGFESTIYLYCDATALVAHVRKDVPAAHYDYSSTLMRSVFGDAVGYVGLCSRLSAGPSIILCMMSAHQHKRVIMVSGRHVLENVRY